MTRATLLIVLVALLGAAGWAQAPAASPCRTIGIVSDNDHLPVKYLRTQLGFNLALQDGHFTFTDEANAGINADIVVRARPDYPDAIFRLAVQVARPATGETREALQEDVTREAKQRVAEDVVRAILALCPTPRFQTVLATARREAPRPVVAEEQVPVVAVPCPVDAIQELSLYSTTSYLDERDLRAAIAKDPLARKLGLRTELAPAKGAQITVKRKLGTSFWTFSVTTPEGGFCQQELFILKEADAPRRLARGIVAVVAASRGQAVYADDNPPRPQDFKVEAFGGLAGVKQTRKLVLSLGGRDLVITTPEGLEVARFPASALQDVSTNDYAPAFHSDWDENLSEWAPQEPFSVMAVGAYVALSNVVSFTRNVFTTEHFLDLAWKEGSTVKTASFKVRGRDTKALRATLETMVEAARFAPATRKLEGTLLANEK